jgi:phage-related protein
MPETEVIFYADGGEAPALEWVLDQPKKVRDKFQILLELLEKHGGGLSRPYAAPLRDKIYELRARHMQVNYRLLYFFHGSVAAVVAHGCTKEDKVDASDINRAINRRAKFMANPALHTHQIEE